MSALIRILENPTRGITVGRCETNKPFVGVIDRPRGTAVLFVFDHAGHFLQAYGRDADPTADARAQLAPLLAPLEPYTFEDEADIRPFQCKVRGTSAGLTARASGYELRPPGLPVPPPPPGGSASHPR